MAHHFTWKTAAVKKETKDALTIYFDTRGETFDYKAGQFINLNLLIRGEKIKRSYSLSSTPGINARPAITVKRVPGGKASNYIFDYAQRVNYWQVEGPFGLFHPGTATIAPEYVVLIAAGSGITPVFSQLRHFLHNSTSHILLVYANRKEEDMIFRNELLQLEDEFRDRLTIWSILSRQNTADQPSFSKSIDTRLSKLVLKKILKKQPGFVGENTLFFVCGPAAFIKMTEDTMAGTGIDKSNLHREYFAPPESQEDTILLPETTMEVMFHFYDQTNLLEVKPGKTILDAALEDKIPLRYSCKNGTCGTCIGRKLSGNVHMPKNYALNEAMVNNGYLLLCQSYALDNNVTIEAGMD